LAEHTFCEKLFNEVMREVRSKVPSQVIQESWGRKSPGSRPGEVDFQININKCDGEPEGFLWNGWGCCVWKAKAKGWIAYLLEREVRVSEKSSL